MRSTWSERALSGTYKGWRISARISTLLFGSVKKGNKSFKKNRLVKYSDGGVNLTVEATSTQTAIDCNWIGHTTGPIKQMYKEVVRAMIYKFLKKADFEPVESDTIVDGILAGEIFSVMYRLAPNLTLQFENYVVPATFFVIDNFIDWWFASARPWSASGDTEFQSITFKGTHSMRVSETLIYQEVKTSLKIQNRSVVAEGDDEDDVTNVPLYGKIYYGNGTGLNPRKMTNQSAPTPLVFVSDLVTGTVINTVGDPEARNPYREPVQGNSFSNCRKTAKAHLEPGQIKTSVLRSTYVHYFNTFHGLAHQYPDAGTEITAKRFREIGKFAVFALEKMINVDLTAPIVVAMENNLEISTKAVIKNRGGLLKKFLPLSI